MQGNCALLLMTNEKPTEGTSLVVGWLRLQAFHVEGHEFHPWPGDLDPMWYANAAKFLKF